MKKVGLIVNPYAGAGGRIGLKGSDNLKSLNPEIPSRVSRFLKNCPKDIYFITPQFRMGEIYFKNFHFNLEIIPIGNSEVTTSKDTIESVKEMIRRDVEIIIFVGGDGTARDILTVLNKESITVLGIPAGVKMHSGVFASTPEAAARLLEAYIRGYAKIIDAEIIDVDENEFRNGIIKLTFYGYLKSIDFNNLLTPSKQEVVSYEEDEIEEISDYIINEYLDDSYHIVFGTGKTVKAILKKLGYEVPVTSINVTKGKRLILKNATYHDLMKLSDPLRIILTPIGNQGFIIGRGNQEIGPEVLKKLRKKEDIIIISTISKLQTIICLRIDSGSEEVDSWLKGVFKVIVGNNKFYAIKTCE